MRSPIAKRRVINWYFVGPVLGYVATAVVIVAAVVHFVHHSGRVTVSPANAVHLTSNDGLTRELAHCQAIGARAANDTACIAAWAENRRRFFGGGSAVAHPPVAPTQSEQAAQP